MLEVACKLDIGQVPQFHLKSAQMLPAELNLLQHFAVSVSPALLEFPEEPFDVVHHFLLNNILLDPHLNAYPPSPDYRVLFWKWAINNLEHVAKNQDVEIDSRIYDNLISLMNSPASLQRIDLLNSPSPSYVTYYWPFDPTVIERATLLESQMMIEQGTTGLRTWPAAIALANYLVTVPSIVANKRVLELGSGTGFLGIIVATLQIRQNAVNSNTNGSLWLTDINEEVLARCHHNLRLPCNRSSSHPSVQCHLLDWSAALNADEKPSLGSLLGKIAPDVVLGADIVYDPIIIPSLIAVLRLALSPAHAKDLRVSILALTVRNPATYAQFLQAAELAFTITKLDSNKVESLFAYRYSQGQEIKILQLEAK